MMIAVEYGAEWRFVLRPEAGVDLVMVVEHAGEDPLLFARRFLGKLVTLVDGGADVVSGALAVTTVVDVRRLEARCVIARALLRAFRVGAKSLLYLVEPSGATQDCRSHLTAIAEGLLESEQTDSRIQVGYASHTDAAVVNAVREWS